MKVILDWLSANASKYGFILRYPEGKSDITGYIFEPWHFRYVGKDLAEKLYQNGEWITLEEYFGVDSVYRGY
jgi:D-alanyl-D-alanine carboxypeptidase